MQEAGYTTLPKPMLIENVDNMTKEQFLDIYEFGVSVRDYIFKAAELGLKLERQTLFSWVSNLHPEKVEYGRHYSD